MPFWSISVIDRSRAITTMGAQVAVYLDKKQICQYFRATNKQALFWVGVHKYFVQDQNEVGKQILLQANIEEDKYAKYGLAIALLCESNDEGIQLLLSNSKPTKWKTIATKLSTNPSNTVFGTNTFRIPKNQACKKNGVGHWDCECPSHMEMKNYM